MMTTKEIIERRNFLALQTISFQVHRGRRDGHENMNANLDLNSQSSRAFELRASVAFFASVTGWEFCSGFA